MEKYNNRFYRSWSKPSGLISFKVTVGETDLFISADKDLTKQAEDAIQKLKTLGEVIEQSTDRYRAM